MSEPRAVQNGFQSPHPLPRTPHPSPEFQAQGVATPVFGAVVLAHGDEPVLGSCLTALLEAGCDRIAMVDNGYHTTQELPVDNRIQVIRPGWNTGFTGGCNLGAAAIMSACDVLVFVNSDLVVSLDAPRQLARTLADPDIGLVCGLVVLLDDPDTVNSVGLPVHFSLMAWAGGWGSRVDEVTSGGIVAAAAGALMAVRSSDWDALEGLFEPLFAYGEDVELSMRVWQRGLSVRLDTSALGFHAYEFSRNQLKFYLLERNRLINLLTLYEARTLRAFALPLATLELAVCVGAALGGWLPQKVAGYRWIAKHAGAIKARRTWVQERRVVPDADILPLLQDQITPADLTGLQVPRVFNAFLGASGAWARRRLARAEARTNGRVRSRRRRGVVGTGG